MSTTNEKVEAILTRHYLHWMTTTGDRPPKEECRDIARECNAAFVGHRALSPVDVGSYFTNRKNKAEKGNRAPHYSTEQRKYYEDVYRITHHPFLGTRYVLMSQTGHTFDQVKHWFENKRRSDLHSYQKLKNGGRIWGVEKKMQAKYDQDPDAFIQGLLGGALSLKTGEPLDPPVAGYANQPLGWAIPPRVNVNVSNAAASSGFQLLPASQSAANSQTLSQAIEPKDEGDEPVAMDTEGEEEELTGVKVEDIGDD